MPSGASSGNRTAKLRRTCAFMWLPSSMMMSNGPQDRKSTRLNSSHLVISYAVFCLKKKNTIIAIIFFFFNDTATTEIYTLSLHDALPIFAGVRAAETPPVGGLRILDRIHAVRGEQRKQDRKAAQDMRVHVAAIVDDDVERPPRSEEHTSELQSPCNLVCRLLLEKKKHHHRYHFFFF